MKKALLYLFLIVIISGWYACRKDPIITDSSAKLEFSQDSILFDTVFTQVGSTTKLFKLYNTNSQTISISDIRLGLGEKSFFRLNVNGTPGKSFKNVEVPGNDSLFVFVEVTVDPGNTNNPFIVSDSIIFNTNGNIQDVNLVAWGQNAHYIRPNQFPKNGLPNYSVIACDTTWGDNIPHVIYGYAVVDSLCKLTITEGAKIYLYKNAGLWVFSGGKLNVTGTKEKPVTFQGTRLEAEYKDLPGQWDRIWINEGSEDNIINYAIIKNGFIGIQAEDLSLKNPLQNTLQLSNTVIKNMSGMGILSRLYNIKAKNLVVSNCGQYALAVTGGGEHSYKHCTFANFWDFSQRKTPSVFLTNYFTRGNAILVGDLTGALFGNSIIYGNLDNEFGTDFFTGGVSNYKFDHSLVKLESANATPADRFVSVILNSDPGFKDHIDYEITSSSPTLKKGLMIYGLQVPQDLKGNPRIISSEPNPDMGAFEFKP